jgi:hypothetical protein
MFVFTTPDPITVEVRNAAGSITVELSDSTTTTVDLTVTSGHSLGFLDDIARAFRRPGSPSGAPDDFGAGGAPGAGGWERTDEAILDRVRVDLVERDGHQTLIVDTDPAARAFRTGFTVRIAAPTGSGVRIASQSADATVIGVADRLDVRTASGEVTSGDVTGSALVHTASGDIRLTSVGGAFSARSASGDVTVSTVSGSLVVHSTSGDVRVGVAGGNVEVRTVSGDVEIGDAIEGSAQVTAVSGDVEIGVHKGTLAAINLATVSGDTRSDISITDVPVFVEEDESDESGDSGRKLDIRVRTTSGDIRLRHAAA